MQKKVVILTSYVTGQGHKSITEAIENELKNTDISYKIVEGYELGGKFAIIISKLYAPLISKSKRLWKTVYKISEKRCKSTNRMITFLIKGGLKKLLKEYDPDLIVSVHANFNGSILNVLEKRKKKIPMMVVYADLFSIHPLWIDKRLNLSIVPTNQASVIAQKNGVKEENIKVIKLPVRKQIIDVGKKVQSFNEEDLRKKEEIRFLLMSGGEGAGNYSSIIKKLLTNKNFKLSIITGKNEKLKKDLEKKFKKYLDRVTIYGYVKDVGSIMKDQDIGIVRGSPNVLMECITCLLPVIISGVLPGQEEGNIDFVLLNKLGVLWQKDTDIMDIINTLLENKKEKLIEIKKNQMLYRDFDSAKKIVKEIQNLLK